MEFGPRTRSPAPTVTLLAAAAGMARERGYAPSAKRPDAPHDRDVYAKK